MRKIFLCLLAAIAISASALLLVRAGQKMNRDSFDANVDALSDNEGNTVTIPCVPAVSTCTFVMFDALGNPYSVTVDGFAHI